MTTVYKVLSRHNKHLVSAFIEDRIVTVRYMLNKPARPKIKGSLLAAFSTLAAAKRYIQHSNLAIYVADAKISRATKVADCNIGRGDQDPRLIKASWESSKKLHKSIANWPNGTVFCTEITLLKRVV